MQRRKPQHSQMDFHSLGVYSFESLSQNFVQVWGLNIVQIEMFHKLLEMF